MYAVPVGMPMAWVIVCPSLSGGSSVWQDSVSKGTAELVVEEQPNHGGRI
jgi:hypothetical protein